MEGYDNGYYGILLIMYKQFIMSVSVGQCRSVSIFVGQCRSELSVSVGQCRSVSVSPSRSEGITLRIN